MAESKIRISGSGYARGGARMRGYDHIETQWLVRATKALHHLVGLVTNDHPEGEIMIAAEQAVRAQADFTLSLRGVQ